MLAFGGVVTFGGLFLASFLAISDLRPPHPSTDDPLGVAFCLVALTLAIRSFRLGLTIRPGVIVVRGYFLTRRVAIAEIESVGVIDYPGPWWLNTERLRGLRLSRRGAPTAHCLGRHRQHEAGHRSPTTGP